MIDAVDVKSTRIGARRDGKLRTGVVSAHAGEGAKASIPCRFETIFSGQREHNAFGRRTYRFDDPEDDLPGPGAYSRDRSIVKQAAASFSKKGMSAFATPVGLMKQSTASRAPGPGAYTKDVIPSNPALLDKGAHASERPTAVFVNPTPKPVLRSVRPTPAPPGPGQYYPQDLPTTLNGPCAAMSSRAATGSPVGSQRSAVPDSIGPGSYIKPEHVGLIVKDAMRPSHFSLSGTRRFGPPKGHEEATRRVLSTSLPPILAASYDVDRLAVPSVVKEVREDQRRSVRSEGAGGSRTVKPSFMFCDTNLDRFGNPVIRYTAPPSDALGPGSYELEKQPKRMLISSSWALSGTKRDEIKDRYQPPGPAYYSAPLSPSRVSHRVADPSAFVA